MSILPKFYWVQRLSRFIDNLSTNAYHAEVFHGRVERSGQKNTSIPLAYLNSTAEDPLDLMRSGSFIPAIFCPASRALFVNSLIAERLSKIPHTALRQVRMKKLVNLNLEAGAEWIRHNVPTEPERAAMVLKDVPDLHQRVGSYFELLLTRYLDIDPLLRMGKQIEIDTGSPGFPELTKLELSADIFKEYLIFMHPTGLIISSELFPVFDIEIDRRFFMVRKYQLY